jgi:hypothetical protein
VIVGPQKKTFFISNEVICAESKFFETAFKEAGSHSRKRTVTLPKDDPTIFGIFLVWITTHNLEDAEGLASVNLLEKPAKSDAPNSGRAFAIEERFEQLVRCFILGDSLQSANFQNSVLDSTIRVAKVYSMDYKRLLGGSTAAIKLVYLNSTSNSPLRKYILDMFLSGIGSPWLENNIKNYLGSEHAEFLTELLPRALARDPKSYYPTEFPWTRPWQRDSCYYHRHPDQKEGFKCTNKKS